MGDHSQPSCPFLFGYSISNVFDPRFLAHDWSVLIDDQFVAASQSSGQPLEIGDTDVLADSS
jgi:hypothetical protein